jgi:hypothetical protein
MKSVRVWLLLLLALLLPVRGAVAAAMLCPIAGSGVQTEMQVQAPAADHAAHEAMHEHKDAHEHAASHVHTADHDHGKAADRCNLCSAFCSLTPLVGSVPTVATPLDLSSTAFPDLSAPPPSFLSDGQERPPRSI